MLVEGPTTAPRRHTARVVAGAGRA